MSKSRKRLPCCELNHGNLAEFFEPSGNLLSARAIQWPARGSRPQKHEPERKNHVQDHCNRRIRRMCRGGVAGAIAAAAKPTDPQIAHIAYTAGQLDIEAGKQALDKSKNTDVRAFAQRMVGDHTAVNDQALALSKS
jgi:Domain of unknown function (DUF4142)